MVRKLARRVLHTVVYHLLIRPSRGRVLRTRAAGFDLTVPPGVFHPKWFLSSELLARFVGRRDLRAQRVIDIGTGSGILALAAARAGASFVAAVDINPAAASTAARNARDAGLGDVVAPFAGDLLQAVAPSARFDLVLSNPPFFPGEPRDLADRAWHAGPGYRDISQLFRQVANTLAAGGIAYVVLSTDADLAELEAMMEAAGLVHRIAHERRLFFESLLVYELSRDGRDVTRA
jgi:HemK-related putative methylase